MDTRVACVTCGRWPAVEDGMECVACVTQSRYLAERDASARQAVAWAFVLVVACALMVWACAHIGPWG